MMGKRILILGAGFGGLAAANILRKGLDRNHRIIIIDKKKSFMMGFVKLWVLAGSRKLEESQTLLDGLNAKGIEYLNDEIVKIDTASCNVLAKDHGSIEYDYLIVALGAELVPEMINGFVGRGYNLYDAAQVPKLRERLLSLRSGKIAIAIMDTRYKCPPAPYEAAMIISNLLAQRRIRNSVDIDLYVPSQIALPVAGPQISTTIVEMISQQDIHFHPSHKLKSVSDRQLDFENGIRQYYDVLIGIPPHRAPEVVRSSGLTCGGNWIAIDRLTMKTAIKNVYAVGDVTEVKVGAMALPKAGIFAEEEAKVAARQIIDTIMSKTAIATFSGQGYCFMETGSKRACCLEVDFYNETGPLIKLEAPSEKNFEKKQDFERIRVNEWLF